jgi:Tol biopolymer transport system component
VIRDSALSAAGGTASRGAVLPVFSADGSRLVYMVPRAPHCFVFERDLATDVERQLFRDSTNSGTSVCPSPVDWSADGAHLLVRRDTVLQIVQRDPWRLVREVARPGSVIDGRFSPHGRALAFTSTESGRSEVYIEFAPGGTPARVSVEGGRWPNWSEDGRTLFFLTPDGRVQEVTISGASAASVSTPRTRFLVNNWRRSTFDDRGTGLAVVNSGERYLVRMSPAGIGLAYVQNWPALLQQRDSTR